MKFGRAYEFTITPSRGGAPINLASEVNATNYQEKIYSVSHPVIKNGAVSNGLTIKFDIQKGFQVNNRAIIELYNLNPSTRAYLDQDKFKIPFAKTKEGKTKLDYRIINLKAGYVNRQGEKQIFDLIFQGSLMEGGTKPVGNTFITKLSCQENGYYNNGTGGLIAKSYGEGATLKNLVQDCLKALDFTLENAVINGILGKLNDPIRPQSYFGRAYSILKQYFGDNFYITDGVPYFILENEAVEGTLKVINVKDAARNDSIIEFEISFEPRLMLGQYIAIKSQSSPQLNGGYKIVGIRHNGTISPAVDEEKLTTTVELLKESFIKVNF